MQNQYEESGITLQVSRYGHARFCTGNVDITIMGGTFNVTSQMTLDVTDTLRLIEAINTIVKLQPNFIESTFKEQK